MCWGECTLPLRSRAVGWRSLLVSQPARLSLQHSQLRLEQEGGLVVTVPVEDLSVLVLETGQALISSALLSALAAQDVAVLTCDASHHPNGVLLPYLPHSRSLKVLQSQLGLSQPQKKRAWQTLVQQKIQNQGHCLNRHRPGRGDWLLQQVPRVQSGDADGREASAARYYFAELFGPGFSRSQSGWVNAALNYGYAVLRAAVARSIVCHGFMPALGLQHQNQLNAFNLADDLLEPLRPLVDDWVRQQAQPQAEVLQAADKAELVRLLYAEVQMQAGRMQVLAAADAMAQSLGRYCQGAPLNTLDWPRGLPVDD